MHMETLSYPIVPSPVLGSTPLTPPSEGVHYPAPLFSETQYTQTKYQDSDSFNHQDSANLHHDSGSFHLDSPNFHHDPYGKLEDETNNNSYTEEENNFYISSGSDSLTSGLSNLSICPEEVASTCPPVDAKPSQGTRKSKKSSRSKAKSSTSSVDSNGSSDTAERKNSFVYDVRLPDEQFLFFVPDLDLVKSHLMFAVREEVDVLKDRIVELMDRINHLECENSILRQYASQEVLQQIQAQLPHQIQQPSHHSSTS